MINSINKIGNYSWNLKIYIKSNIKLKIIESKKNHHILSYDVCIYNEYFWIFGYIRKSRYMYQEGCFDIWVKNFGMIIRYGGFFF